MTLQLIRIKEEAVEARRALEAMQARAHAAETDIIRAKGDADAKMLDMRVQLDGLKSKYEMRKF